MMIDNKITEDVRVRLIKEANPIALDRALVCALKTRLGLVASWLRDSEEEIIFLRGETDLLMTQILSEKLEELIK